MLLFCPYQVDTLIQRNPWGNFAIILATVVVSILGFAGGLSEEALDAMVLSDWSTITGLLGHQFLHGGILHLVGNMIFLYVFGNAVCGVMNTFVYVAIYLAMGALAGAVHLLFNGDPAIGASGAISGIVGLYLAIYPTNTISCFWFFLIRGGTVEMSGWLPIIGWFLLDLYGAFRGHDNTAYYAHLGGTVVGFAIGLLLLRINWIDLFEYDHPTVPQLIAARRGEKQS